MATICSYAGGVKNESYNGRVVKSSEFTMRGVAYSVIYRMKRNLYAVITRAQNGINKSMNFWRELLINGVYLAAVIAAIYILTYTDIVSHWLAY